MNTAVLLLSACTVGADPAVVQVSGFAKGGDCCGKAVVAHNDCAPKCGCGFFTKLKAKFCSPCAKPACDVCPKPAPVCHPCPKPVVHAPVCNKCEKTHNACDTCAPKKKCGLLGCLNFHINLCHGCSKGGHKTHDTGCGTAVINPSYPVAPVTPPAPVTPKPETPNPKAMPKVGTNYNPAHPDLLPVSGAGGKIIIDVVPRN